MSAANLTETPNVLLVLPFTAGLLRDPSALLRLLFHTAERATSTVSVVFTTPGSGAQLYSALRAAPRKHFDALQNFLAEVYAALAAGHWAAGRVLVDVEVHFDGELGDWTQKLLATPDRVVLLESHPDIGSHILGATAVNVPRTLVDPPSLPPAGDLPADTAEPGWGVVAMGGTFDHLHAAHKLLLQAALFITETRLIVGVISPKLLASKTNAALIEPLDARLGAVNGFLSRCGLGDRIPYVIEIEDALGPTAWDPEVSAIAVSRETLAGAAEVNRVRGSKGLSLLDVLSVNVISSTLEQEGGEEVLRTVDLSEVPDDELKHSKMGSTGVRAWMAQRNQK